jgi:hypothetical protein
MFLVCLRCNIRLDDFNSCLRYLSFLPSFFLVWLTPYLFSPFKIFWLCFYFSLVLSFGSLSFFMLNSLCLSTKYVKASLMFYQIVFLFLLIFFHFDFILLFSSNICPLFQIFKQGFLFLFGFSFRLPGFRSFNWFFSYRLLGLSGGYLMRCTFRRYLKINIVHAMFFWCSVHFLHCKYPMLNFKLRSMISSKTAVFRSLIRPI